MKRFALGSLKTSCCGLNDCSGISSAAVVRCSRMRSKLVVVAGNVLTYVLCEFCHFCSFKVVNFIHGILEFGHSHHSIMRHVVNQLWQGINICGDVLQVFFEL